MSALVIIPNVNVRTLDGSRVVQDVTCPNKVVATGRNVIRDLLLRGTPGSGVGVAPTHMALGTGSTTVTDSDTVLDTEAYRDEITTRLGNDIVGNLSMSRFQLFVDLTQGNGGGSVTYTEAGLFDSPTTDAGNMLARVVFSTPVVKTSSVQLVATWSIFFASSG